VLNYVKIEFEGKSLKPMLEGKRSKVNDIVFAEYSGGAVEESLAGIGDRYKYYYKEKQGGMIYDLENDPSETKPIKNNLNDEMLKVIRSTESFYGDRMDKQPGREK
jgi:hypothetical protein